MRQFLIQLILLSNPKIPLQYYPIFSTYRITSIKRPPPPPPLFQNSVISQEKTCFYPV